MNTTSDMTATPGDRIRELISSGQWDEAQRELDGAGADSLASIERNLYTGMLLEHQKRWAEAADAFEAVLAEDPDQAEAVFQLAYIADRHGDDACAIALYERCTAKSPAHVNALMNLAVLYEDAERYGDAFTCVARVLDEHDDHTRARMFEEDIIASMAMYYDEEGEREREKVTAVLEMPISDFEISVRSSKCLKEMDIRKLGDLLTTTASELLGHKSFGVTSLREVEFVLTRQGLMLGQLLEEKSAEALDSVIAAEKNPGKANLLKRSVAELTLSVRSRKCLMRLGIDLIGELTRRSERELLGSKNFGVTSLEEIKQRLSDFGLSLKGPPVG